MRRCDASKAHKELDSDELDDKDSFEQLPDQFESLLIQQFPDKATDTLMSALRANEHNLPLAGQLSNDAFRELARRSIKRGVIDFLQEHKTTPQIQSQNGHSSSSSWSQNQTAGFHSSFDSISPDQLPVPAVNTYSESPISSSNPPYIPTNAITPSYNQYNNSFSGSYDNNQGSW
jgi:hypothetical protein